MTTVVRSPIRLVWALVVLCAVGCSASQAGTDGPAGTRLDPQLLDSLVAETVATRGLPLRRPVEAVALSEVDIRAHVAQQIDELDLEKSEKILRAFGFLSSTVDLRDLVVEIMSAEVVGMYDPRSERLMVVESVVDGLDGNAPDAMMGRMVMVHEITHALQHQHFETLAERDQEAWTDDEQSVLACLAEGDATLTMMASLFRGAGPAQDRTLSPDFAELLRVSSQQALPSSPALGQAPPYFGHVLAATYLEGAAFVATLRRLGGWEAVDEAHRHPPRATRDILHPNLFLAGAPLYRVSLPERLPGFGEPAVHRATLGELETGAYLLPLEDEDRRADAAAGWSGDQFALFEHEAGLSLAWRLHFESSGDAEEFFTAAGEVAELTGRGPCSPAARAGASSRDQRVVQCPESRDWLAVRASDVALVRRAPAGQGRAILEALLEVPAVLLPMTRPDAEVFFPGSPGGVRPGLDQPVDLPPQSR